MNAFLFVGLLLVLGLASTRVMRALKMPNVTGYLIVGLLAALACTLIEFATDGSVPLLEGLDNINGIVSTVALGFIALSIGQEFRIKKIKKLGKSVVTITIVQALLTVILVDGGLALLCVFTKLPINIALCLGAIAAATAPAATLMVIHQYNAHGPLVDTLLPIVAFDDAIGLMIFSLSLSISKTLAAGGSVNVVTMLLLPLLEIVGSLVLGFVLGYFLHLMIKFFRSRNNHVTMIITFTLLGVGAVEALNTIVLAGETLEFSSLLTCMMIGAVYNNFSHKEEKLIMIRDFSLVDRWTPFLFLLFFVLSGCHLVTSFTEILKGEIQLGMVAAIFATYLILRSTGKYFGGYLGSKWTRQPDTTKKYLGLALLPQAGVAIGMANTISKVEAFKTNGTGDIIVTVVLCATLVYELFGPLLTKWALTKAGEIDLEHREEQPSVQ